MPSSADDTSRVPTVKTHFPWRVASLVLVHLAMLAHIAHWWFNGRSVGRFVLSDSARTLERGEVNPGFLLFVAAIGVSALFGRLLCGWVCHMGALQDLSAWMLGRLGIKPRLFRSRLLAWVPTLLALYLFAWPLCFRLVQELNPPKAGQSDLMMAAERRSGFSASLATERLWEDLPSPMVAVPFLLLCGMGTVYVLGARGLCRYGCPYGSLLRPAERLSRWKVVVDPSKCDQCGLCTTACSAGVRVHEEVRRFGAVRSRDCVRSLDCVAICPTRALSFSRTQPRPLSICGRASATRPDHELSTSEELVCAATFILVCLGTRGLYGLIPLLLSATLGILGAYVAWLAWRLPREGNVRFSTWQLRLGGRLLPSGWVFLAGVGVLFMLTIHSIGVKAIIAVGSSLDRRITTSFEEAVSRTGSSEQARADAARAIRSYRLARPLRSGGIAFLNTPEADFRRAWLEVVRGDRAEAESILRGLAGQERTRDVASRELARLLLASGRTKEATSVLTIAVERDLRSYASRELLAAVWTQQGRAGQAESMFRRICTRFPGDSAARAGLIDALCADGRPTEALSLLEAAVRARPRDARARAELLALTRRLSDTSAATPTVGVRSAPTSIDSPQTTSPHRDAEEVRNGRRGIPAVPPTRR